MSAATNQTQPAAQAGSTGEASGVGPAVGGVRSSDGLNWLDLWALNPEMRRWPADGCMGNMACGGCGTGGVEGKPGRRTECLGMKRPGKPDTGNPFVRFDEGRSDHATLTATVSSSRLPSLRLLYLTLFRIGKRLESGCQMATLRVRYVGRGGVFQRCNLKSLAQV
jgi:hypothetical protein